MDGAQVDQRSGRVRIEFQRLLVSFDDLRQRRARLFQFQPLLEPGFGFLLPRGPRRPRPLSGKLQQALQLRAVEIQQKLAGDRFHLLPFDEHRDLLALADDFQFPEGVGHPFKYLAQRPHRLPDARRGHPVLAQLVERAQRDQIGEREIVQVRDQLLLLPAPQLPLGDAQHPPSLFPRIRLLWLASLHCGEL